MAIHSTAYLYNIEPAILSNMLYSDALKFKVASAKVLLNMLLEPHYSERDDERIMAVQRAVKFNESLLAELK